MCIRVCVHDVCVAKVSIVRCPQNAKAVWMIMVFLCFRANVEEFAAHG